MDCRLSRQFSDAAISLDHPDKPGGDDVGRPACPHPYPPSLPGSSGQSRLCRGIRRISGWRQGKAGALILYLPNVITGLVPVIHLPACSAHEGIRLYPRIQKNGTLYTGVTSTPSRRLFEHQHDLTPGFTSRYGVKTLVWLEEHDLVVNAIKREKAIKKYPREWKINLIEASNPDWTDLSSWLFDAR